MRNRLFNTFMAPDGGGTGAGTGSAGAGSGTGEGAGATGAGQQNQPPAFDYEKLASLVAGKQTVTEESVLKGYFKQQGLSQEEMAQAIQAFKDQKAANQPDVAGMQNQLNEAQNQVTMAQKAAQQAQIQSAATMAAVSLGIDAKTIPFLLKMADLSQVMGQDGKINDEAVKTALNAVLEAVPQLKPTQGEQKGFQIGGSGAGTGQQQTTSQNQPQTPSKRWNRWNN